MMLVSMVLLGFVVLFVILLVNEWSSIFIWVDVGDWGGIFM